MDYNLRSAADCLAAKYSHEICHGETHDSISIACNPQKLLTFSLIISCCAQILAHLYIMSRGGGPWTEFPRETAFRGTSVRSAKTAPATPFIVRDALSDSIVSTFLGQSESLEWAASPSLADDHLASNTALDLTVLEDLESDLSSASGPSASVSLVSTPSLEPISDSVVLPSTLPESHRNTTYASRMHMSQFQQEQSRFKWDSFVQRIKEGLPEKVVHQNKFFQLIDYGGSGSVHATAFKMHRDCDTLAIKVLRNKKVDTNIDLPNEFQIMRGLKHNHIVAFVGTFSRKGQFAVLMYPVAICNLAEYLKDASESNLPRNRREPRQWKTLLTAFGCLSSAVRYLHTSRKIKHKDIKPENILVDRYGSVLLADFGISKQYEDDTLTEGTTPFTDKYAPPEVVDQDKRGLSSDIFSLGCVFLEMATVTLGESLENLSCAVFDTRNRQSYRDSPSKVSNWISQLKRVAILEAHSSYSAGSQNPSDSDHIIDNQNLTTQHLDAVLSMMSRSPTDRPSITAVYELFKGFANQCLECQSTGVYSDSTRLCTTRLIQRQDARLERSCSHKPSSKTQVLPAALTEARAVIDQSQPAFQAIARQGSTQDNFGWKDGGHGYPSSLETLKAQSPMAIDETESDYSSEAESFYSDSDTADDRNPRSDAESERRIVELKSMIQPLLDKKRALILSFLRNIDGVTGVFRYCPADGSSGSRRQGSPINGPPGKRRSVENRKALPLPEEDGNGESDGEEDPGERHDRNKDSKFNGSSRPRMLACPFHQRDRSRFTNRACQWPGWAEFHRLK